MPKRAVGATSPHGAAASATYEFWLIGIENLRDADRVYMFIYTSVNGDPGGVERWRAAGGC
jgi:hypothetical protein